MLSSALALIMASTISVIWVQTIGVGVLVLLVACRRFMAFYIACGWCELLLNLLSVVGLLMLLRLMRGGWSSRLRSCWWRMCCALALLLLLVGVARDYLGESWCWRGTWVIDLIVVSINILVFGWMHSNGVRCEGDGLFEVVERCLVRQQTALPTRGGYLLR